MQAELRSWFVKILIELAVFGVPAGGVLWYWNRRGVKSKVLNYASSANLAFYLLWLTVAVIVVVSPGLPPLIDYRAPQYVFFFCPLIAALASIFLCLLSALAESGERTFVFLANGLVLVLWVCAVVAPN